MSIQEIRQNIIYDNINKLIKSITPFQETDENFDLCEKFAHSLVRNHRYLTVNSHEIKRRLDGLSERFEVSNNQRYSDRLKALCQQLINNPICMEHYERDIQWSILNFLLELSYNPVNNSKKAHIIIVDNKKQNKIIKTINENDGLGDDDDVEQQENINQLKNERENLIKLLLEDNFKDLSGDSQLQNENDDEDSSDLSNWSDEDEPPEDDDDDELNVDNNQPNINNEFLSIQAMLNTEDEDGDDDEEESVQKCYKLQPPVKLQHYKLFPNKESTSHKWLNDNLQTNWWQTIDFNCEINSNKHTGANFCHIWNNKLLTLTNIGTTGAGKLNKPPKKPIIISTISEYCLLREIIWMFNKPPMNCKFFHMDEINEEIQLNENVSIPSVTLNGIKSYLKHFTSYMTIVYRLKKFYENVHNPQKIGMAVVDAINQTGSTSPPYSYECYANGLIQLLNPMDCYLIEKERELIDETNNREIDMTIIRLYNEMNNKGYFQIIDRLYDIHKYSVLDFTKNYSHICTAHLLAGLLVKTKTTASIQHSNLAGALFLYTIKIYLQIIDIWWTDGRLEDWHNEFLIDKDYDDHHDDDDDGKLKYKLRLLHKCKEQSFYVNPMVSNLIEGSKFIKLLKEHSVQAGYALNILLSFDRIHELKLSYINQENLYTTFINEFLKDLLQLTGTRDDVKNSSSPDDNQQKNINNELQTEFHQSLIKFNDNILTMAFERGLLGCSNNDADQANNPTDIEQLNAYSLYERLTKASIQILPFEHMIMKILSKLLESRTSVANTFVIKMFKDEYRILQHLQNLRKVFLMEAGDLMYFFYSNLFQEIESGSAGNWANPYLLTIQLNGILCSKYPDMSSLFNIEIISGSCSKYALDAIDGIKLNYLINENLRNIINESHLKQYNEVFRFLLKIKWGQWSLENLRFPRKWKRRLPFQELTLDDVIIKRLALVRNWILYSMQSIHSHLMTLILQTMGQQLDERIGTSMNLLEIIAIHNSYINTIYNHCFQCSNGKKNPIHIGIEQLLNLINVVQIEWDLLCTQISSSSPWDSNRNGMDSADGGNLSSLTTCTNELSIYSSQIEEIESTYINCHCYLAGLLNAEVYSKNQSHLSGLSAAFNCSCPY